MFKTNKNISLVNFFLLWRFLTLYVSFVAISLLPVKSDFTFLEVKYWDLKKNLLYLWSNFDGVHYLNIARYGYGAVQTGKTQVFFPLYPLLIRLFNLIIGNPLITSLLISQLALIIGLYFLYKLVMLDYPKSTARLTSTLLLLFPTAFFFVSSYTESLFLALCVASFYFARKGNYLFAGVLAALLSATRVTGIFLFPALLIEFFLTGPKLNSKNLLNFGFILLSPLGLLVYMFFLKQTTGDPLYFIHLQSQVSSRAVREIILLPQVFFRYLRIMVSVDYSSVVFFTALLEFLISGLFLLLTAFSFRIRKSYGFFAFASYILPTLTGTFLSMPRFVLVLFPAFIVLAKFLENRPILRYFYIALCFIGLIFYLGLFATGHFIS